MPLQLDEFKTRQRQVWGAGDYAPLKPACNVWPRCGT
jgi:hypothetical protein